MATTKIETADLCGQLDEWVRDVIRPRLQGGL